MAASLVTRLNLLGEVIATIHGKAERKRANAQLIAQASQALASTP